MTFLDLRQSGTVRDEITARRLDALVAGIMEGAGVDCWILVSREYAEDPVAQTMLPATWMSSRRRTILVFFNEDTHRRTAITRYELDGLFSAGWDREKEPDQWKSLRATVREANPASIGVSISDAFAHADGLTHVEWENLTRALGPDLAGRVVSGQELAVRWLQTRIDEERPLFEEACHLAHGVLRRALSPEAITPGTTTTADVEWWIRSTVQRELGTGVWFHPAVSVQRAGRDLRGSFSTATKPVRVEKGDLIHIDFGIIWHHLNTDQQQHGYVLRDGEDSVPEGLRSAMAACNRVQDILVSRFEAGRTGNEVLASSLVAATSEGLDPVIYTHPIGYHGHGAGPTIGLWDQQDGVSGSGDIKIFAPSAWSIELMNRALVPEWGDVAIMLEEDAWFDGSGVEYLDGRQTEIWPI